MSVGTLACRQPETTARSAALRAPAVARRPRQRGRRRSVTQRRRPGRIYPYRGRVFCRDCKRRLAANPFPRTTYWRCHHDPANPRHQAAHPDHPRTVQVAETQLDEITRRFLAARVFGPGCAELLAAQLPATDAEAQARRDAQAAALAARIRKLDTAQNAQITGRRRRDAIEVNGVGDRSGLGSGPGPLGWVRSMVGMAGGRSGGRPGWGGSRRRARRRWRTRVRSRRAPSRRRP